MSKVSSVHKNKVSYAILGVILILVPFACSEKNSSINIRLPENQRLEDTAAGWWIKEIGLHYRTESKYITDEIHKLLVKNATLLDKYTDEKDTVISVWDHYGMTKPILIKERITRDGITMEFEYPPPGVPWKEVIPAHYMQLANNRKYELAVVINSIADRRARLFLFGTGRFCKRILLL